MIKIPEYKKPQQDLATERFLTPQQLYLPFCQHTGTPSRCCVSVNESVKEGQIIATQDGFISASLHAPHQGKVIKIEIGNHPNLQRAKGIFLQTDGPPRRYSLRDGVKDLSKEALIKIIAQSGIVGMGGAAFPTHVKLRPPRRIDTLIINGCECEPYLVSDYRLMVENLREIFLGVELICKIIQPREVIFAVEDNKPEAVKQINLFIHTKKFTLPTIKVAVLKTVYPQGGEKQLIYATTGRKVSGSRLPFEVGCLVHNVATCFAIYEAVYFGKPLTERLVSFCGDALVSAKNIWVKIGTIIRELFEKKILEFKSEPKKIISGGPIMGVSLNSLDYPIMKGTGGVLFLRKTINEFSETPCIRCARCLDVCPMNLMPLEYAKRVKKEQYDLLTTFNINDCIECGCCAYVCPAKIPLVHYIKVGKKYSLKSR